MTRFLAEKPLRADLGTLEACESATDSRKISRQRGAGSGMCTGGRIVHHLRENRSQPETHVVFVGDQGRGSLGRKIADGAKTVLIQGEAVVLTSRAAAPELAGIGATSGGS